MAHVNKHDNKVEGKTITAFKQEFMVLFRALNRKFFDSKLPEITIHADRENKSRPVPNEGDHSVKWFLFESQSRQGQYSPCVRFHYGYVMSFGATEWLMNALTREYVHHWQYLTGREQVKDEEFWKKAEQIGYKPELDSEIPPELEGYEG